MKSNPTESIESLLAEREKIVADIAATSQFRDDCAAEQKQLETGCCLTDDKALDRIARLQTITSLAPRRISAKEDALTAADAALLKGCHEFIRNNLGPRGRGLLDQVRARTRAELRRHISDEAALDAAVNNAAAVQEVENFLYRCSVVGAPHDGVVGYANRLIRNANNWDALEKKIS